MTNGTNGTNGTNAQGGSAQALFEEISRELGPFCAGRTAQPDPKRTGLDLSAVVSRDGILPASERLLSKGFTLLDISTAQFQEGFLLTYHFDSFERPFRIALRVLADKDSPEVPSIWPAYQGAEWHERESFDFFGVAFPGNPNLIPLLLPDDLQGAPPLRKRPEALASLDALKILEDGRQDAGKAGPGPAGQGPDGGGNAG